MLNKTIIDDMHSIFESASDAYRGGKLEGQQKLYFHAMQALSLLSSEFEKSGSTDSFRAAEDACQALRKAHEDLLTLRIR